ncbi:MAG: AraC family transcriptional regulator [Armatimonadetes bacterium]|nr:AraC family transcriptional regulator [Armatimonadota bacterium]
MLEEPQIVRSAEQLTAVVPLRVPRSEIQAVMGPGIQELLQVVGSQGIGPAGPCFCRHFRLEPDYFDFEISVSVTAPVTPVGRVRGSSLPAVTAARTVYVGPYEGLGPAWGEFDAWVAAQGLEPAEWLWECYVAGPESGSDPSGWRTELNRPLAA